MINLLPENLNLLKNEYLLIILRPNKEIKEYFTENYRKKDAKFSIIELIDLFGIIITARLKKEKNNYKKSKIVIKIDAGTDYHNILYVSDTFDARFINIDKLNNLFNEKIIEIFKEFELYDFVIDNLFYNTNIKIEFKNLSLRYYHIIKNKKKKIETNSYRPEEIRYKEIKDTDEYIKWYLKK